MHVLTSLNTLIQDSSRSIKQREVWHWFIVSLLHHCCSVDVMFQQLCCMCSQFPLKEHARWVSAKTASDPLRSWFILTTILSDPQQPLFPPRCPQNNTYMHKQMNVAVLMLLTVYQGLSFSFKTKRTKYTYNNCQKFGIMDKIRDALVDWPSIETGWFSLQT